MKPDCNTYSVLIESVKRWSFSLLKPLLSTAELNGEILNFSVATENMFQVINLGAHFLH